RRLRLHAADAPAVRSASGLRKGTVSDLTVPDCQGCARFGPIEPRTHWTLPRSIDPISAQSWARHRSRGAGCGSRSRVRFRSRPWGGARKGAGRKPKNGVAGVSHRPPRRHEAGAGRCAGEPADYFGWPSFFSPSFGLSSLLGFSSALAFSPAFGATLTHALLILIGAASLPSPCVPFFS